MLFQWLRYGLSKIDITKHTAGNYIPCLICAFMLRGKSAIVTCLTNNAEERPNTV